jgi:tocopherol O-methyltransferase
VIRPAEQATTAAVARHYDELDPFYRALWGEHLHHGYWATGHESAAFAVRALVDLVATRAGVRTGSDVCDVGCGYGGTAHVVAREFGARVVGYTLSHAQYAVAVAGAAGPSGRNGIAAASQTTAHGPAPERTDGTSGAASNGEELRFVLGDWLANDLQPASFDAVIAIESTEHMADKPRFFTEAARVLRPGGRLVVCAWLAADRVDGWRERQLLEPICAEGRLPSMGTPTEYRALIADAGLALVACDDITERVRRTWRHCTLRLLGRLPRPSTWRYLLDGGNRDRVFALTVPRIWLAYATGAMRYGLFVAERRPSGPHDEASAERVDPNAREPAPEGTADARLDTPRTTLTQVV